MHIEFWISLSEISNENPYETEILPVVGKINDVQRIPIQATLLSALLMMFYFFVAGIVTGKHLNMLQIKVVQMCIIVLTVTLNL